ncbi:MarR family transcriptional regulator [Herbidospora sp. NEAU-GS84]|uniref:MarR family transcriptional regulator n=1 Tax=Herbidospora solisilvae TaxID=2696284 RepID=A0A7C9NPU4_9ACTN|nr:MarR family transcriptional regulator [Herbidospora solisilvae]NAS24096.1 MarR family transcriptional regulator [Herbidospora solisilvae]
MTTTDGVRWLSSGELAAWRSFSLMLARLPAALEEQLQREGGLNFVEYHVLAGLSDAPDRTMRMSGLAVLVNSELSRLSHLMRRLEKRGLVRREPDPCDGRFTNAILTDEGYAHLVKLAPGHVATVRKLVIDALDESRLDSLHQCSEDILQAIDACDAE